jgi:hypothetical protein
MHQYFLKKNTSRHKILHNWYYLIELDSRFMMIFVDFCAVPVGRLTMIFVYNLFIRSKVLKRS